jgi:hypothetical protein
LSPEWEQIESRVTQLLQTDHCKNTAFDFDKNPLQLFLHSILDVSRTIRDASQPKFTDLWFSGLPLGQQVDALNTLVKEYSEMSPLPSLYYALITQAEGCPIQLDSQTIFSKLNHSKFIARKAS